MPTEITFPRVDADGNPLEAPTNDPVVGHIAPDQALLTLFPIQVGEELGLLDETTIPPNGGDTAYLSGPPGHTVNLSLTRIANSGGHSHGGATSDPTAVGSGSPTSVVLPGPYPQNVHILYRANDVCGTVSWTAHFQSGNNISITVNVRIGGLVQIVATSNLRLKAPTSIHPSPYWATPELARRLDDLANRYASRTGKHITITDASLQYGGRFDLNSNWQQPHHEHMSGREADIRNRDQDEEERRIFKEEAANVGLSVLDESNHWHVRLR